jgi:hypothetical protein
MLGANLRVRQTEVASRHDAEQFSLWMYRPDPQVTQDRRYPNQYGMNMPVQRTD